ncbi:MAG: LamB/YcsF family protein [Deltaproteobacteria bacterium]|nr:LamB/YcsF family protein [Deltaproteobacteria bacterium]
MLRQHVKLNADVGELPARVASGEDAALIALLDEANIACGAHAGDDDTMASSVRACLAHGVSIGAHPSYPDRKNFGRQTMTMSSSELGASVREQLQRLQRIAVDAGGHVAFVKPHGALYHDVARDPATASVFFDAVTAVLGPEVPIVLFWRAQTIEPARVRREGFADRGTDDEGELLPRGQPGALLGPDDVVGQVQRVLALSGGIDTLCVHGDGPDALSIARVARACIAV